MLCLYYNCHTHRLQVLLDAVSYLGGESLLYLQPGGIGLNHPRYLAQAGDVSVRDVSHMGLAVEALIKAVERLAIDAESPGDRI